MTQQLELGFHFQIAKAFSPTAPIDERSLFAGRITQVNSLLRTIGQKGQHAVLFGERGVGKTSLANVLSSFISRVQDTVVAPRINCDVGDTFDSVWRKVLDEISMTRSIPSIGFNSSSAVERITSADLIPDQCSPEVVRRLLGQIGESVLPILIIDEFDRLDRMVKRQIADTIKTLSDHAVSATVIIVGVADSVQQLIEEHQSIERALVQVHMPRMTPDEIGEILDKGLGNISFTIEPEAKKKIITLAQGLPHYAHLLGLHASEIAFEDGASVLTSDVVDRAISVSIEDAQQSIKTAWHTATSSPRKDNLFAEVLMACALARTDDLGYFAAQDVREPLRSILNRPIEIANYAQHLADFCGEKKGPVLQRIGESRKYRFRFINPLFQPFVVMQGFATNKIAH